MSTIEWKKEFETELDVIDFQHKLILNRGNELIRELDNNKPKDKIELILKDLIDYLFKHFSFEEHMFDSTTYKDMEIHLIEHEYFRDKLINITNRFLNDEKDISEDLILFFNEWATTHILKTDKDFIESLKKHLKL